MAQTFCMDWPLCGHSSDAECEETAQGLTLRGDSPARPLPQNLRALAAEAEALLTDEEAARSETRRERYRQARREIVDQLEREGLR